MIATAMLKIIHLEVDYAVIFKLELNHICGQGQVNVPGVSKKKYPLLTGNRNETIRYYASRSK